MDTKDHTVCESFLGSVQNRQIYKAQCRSVVRGVGGEADEEWRVIASWVLAFHLRG